MYINVKLVTISRYINLYICFLSKDIASIKVAMKQTRCRSWLKIQELEIRRMQGCAFLKV